VPFAAPGPAATFSPDEVRGLDEPVQRYFQTAIAAGTPLSTGARITMIGRIRIGRWVPFRATEVLAPHTGFLWRATAAGLVTGSDRALAGDAAMRWRIGGVVLVVDASGPDVARSAAGRFAAEGVWVPTALLPRVGVEWHAESHDEVVGRFEVDGVPIELHLTIDADGELAAVRLPRWGDPAGGQDFGWHPFGGPVGAPRTWSGLTVPSEGSVGWRPGTDGWAAGEFFRYRITDLRPFRVS
jgi:hypothetical protein